MYYKNAGYRWGYVYCICNEHQALEKPIFMLQGGTRKVQFLAIIKAIVYIVKRCANYVMGNDDKIKHQIIELDLGHFDETGIV